MSRRKVIVKRLNSIQNFGGMDLLCTDKTGTLTEERVVLMRHCDVAGRENDDVLLKGYLISHFQTGLKNLLDRAILDNSDFHAMTLVEKYKKQDEIPFDFTRRMMSVLVGASAFLPFLPMAPIQVLTNNLLYDFSQVPIPNDAVDEEQVARPRPWNIGEIKRFILLIGPISSIFDYTTLFVMLWLFKCRDPARAPIFQTGWFVESLMTQTLIIHVIRTNKIPFIQSRASRDRPVSQQRISQSLPKSFLS